MRRSSLASLALRLTLVLGVGLPCVPGFAQEPDIPSSVTAAIETYRDALEITDRDRRLATFAESERLFRRALETGAPENAALWTNLGNAALQAENLGPAIHAYRSALRLDPDDPRATANLEHARTLLPGWVPRPDASGALDTFLFWHRRLSPAERSTLAALSFFLAAALAALGIARRRAAPRNLAIVPLFGWVALLATSPGFDRPTDEAVVVVEDAVGRAADSPRAPSSLPESLPAGVEVRIDEARDTWCRIALADGRTAWVPASAVRTIGSPADRPTRARDE